MSFTRVSDYTTFEAEYCITLTGDIVFHFYLPETVSHLKAAELYWHTKFPEALDLTARTYWDAEFPRLKAAFTEEQNSWWLRCFGFGFIGDPEVRVQKFLEKLDSVLERQATDSQMRNLDTRTPAR